MGEEEEKGGEKRGMEAEEEKVGQGVRGRGHTLSVVGGHISLW